MTAGQDAMREAAREEAARVYGQVCREHKQRDDRGNVELSIERALREGVSVADVATIYRVSAADARVVQKRLMRGAA